MTTNPNQQDHTYELRSFCESGIQPVCKRENKICDGDQGSGLLESTTHTLPGAEHQGRTEQSYLFQVRHGQSLIDTCRTIHIGCRSDLGFFPKDEHE